MESLNTRNGREHWLLCLQNPQDFGRAFRTFDAVLMTMIFWNRKRCMGFGEMLDMLRGGCLEGQQVFDRQASCRRVEGVCLGG